MLPFETLGAFVLASTVLCLTPGPDNLFVLSQSAIYGRASGLYVTLGLCLGLLVHTFLVAMGFAVVIQNVSGALTVIKFIGAAYLLYLAWSAFNATSMSLATDQTLSVSHGAMVLRGIIMNLSNPKVSLFFLAFLPQFTSVDYGALAPQMLALGGIFILVTLCVFTLFAMMSGMIRNLLKTKKNAQLYLNRISGLVLAILAITLISSSV